MYSKLSRALHSCTLEDLSSIITMIKFVSANREAQLHRQAKLKQQAP